MPDSSCWDESTHLLVHLRVLCLLKALRRKNEKKRTRAGGEGQDLPVESVSGQGLSTSCCRLENYKATQREPGIERGLGDVFAIPSGAETHFSLWVLPKGGVRG